MKRRHGLLAPGLRSLLSHFSVIFAAALSICPPLARADTVGGSFTLTAPDGTTVTDETYRGKWLLVFFGYASCPDICPATLSEIAVAIEELGPDAAKLQPIFITVDPERDTPEVMGKYTGAIDPRIVGLTGSPQQIAAVAQGYGAYSARHKTGAGAEDYVVDHSTYIYIMDPQGKFVRGLDFDTPTGRIADMLRKIMAQSRE
ncbi:Electron transporter SenC [Mesorhizobium prunaredense]|uniref:Electron transporter SenC n=1 Tax=Mesorhizobium prunaredense TaxID=1631249 RepID=A0A1R3V4S6_9HYPH|nr:SCO family protein [Mesorhizobium prunaredense]SIT54915.1 Electron transporter SenC [Mesorhizobium prunaredense]